ncbi:CCAAT/enhancer-binding protein delta-like [Saccostrea echinata]|uniref:CCAAT/enhancer-binding protein delta-like n=1 Tax=Saccostrea echinata TaxID=191078 RepID=UPI002A82397F|nr:CCAAT/enhancer-binding protein delta-like [Saccostrea echinata]
MLGLHPDPGTYMSMNCKGSISDHSMPLSILLWTTSDERYPSDNMNTSENGDKLTKDPPSNSDMFSEDFSSHLEYGIGGNSNSQIVYTGKFRTESGENMAEVDHLAYSYEVERLLMGISESVGQNFDTNQGDTALPEDLASVSLMQTDTPFSHGPIVGSAVQNTPSSTSPSISYDQPMTSALDSVFSVPTTTDSLVIDLLTHGQYSSGAAKAASSAPQRQDSLIESLPSTSSQLSDPLSPVDVTSDSSSHSISDHLQISQPSSSTTHRSLNLPPPGRPGRKPGPNSNRTYKRRTVPKDTEEYMIKRAKNNIAIRKCREKAKRKQEEMEEKMKELENENKVLKKQVEDLRTEVRRLKGFPEGKTQ